MPVLQAGEVSEGIELIPENDQVNVFLTAVEDNNFEWNGEQVEKLRWTFVVVDDGPWKGKDITGDTSRKFVAHPECRAYNWAVAISGRNYQDVKEFDTDDLIGLKCRALIGHKASKSSGRTFMNVKEVMPPRAEQPLLTHDPEKDGERF